MPRFLESLKVLNGQVFHLALHQERINHTATCFHFNQKILLEKLAAHTLFPAAGLFKWRVVYDENGLVSQELQPYAPKIFSRFLLIVAEDLDYRFKFADRSCFSPYLSDAGTEPLFLKKGLLTDSSYSNLIFRKNEAWLTPKTPLLKGTQRSFLLSQNIISEADISADQLLDFHGFKLINAMMGMEGKEYPLSAIASF